MNEVLKVAAFTGNNEIEVAISERLSYTGDYIEENDITLPNGSEPPEDWVCAIFKPEADMYNFELRCEFDGMLEDNDACKNYGLPSDLDSAVFMGLRGSQLTITNFCYTICNMTGMTCYILDDSDNGYVIEETITPLVRTKSTDEFLESLFEEPMW